MQCKWSSNAMNRFQKWFMNFQWVKIDRKKRSEVKTNTIDMQEESQVHAEVHFINGAVVKLKCLSIRPPQCDPCGTIEVETQSFLHIS